MEAAQYNVCHEAHICLNRHAALQCASQPNQNALGSDNVAISQCRSQAVRRDITHPSAGRTVGIVDCGLWGL